MQSRFAVTRMMATKIACAANAILWVAHSSRSPGIRLVTTGFPAPTTSARALVCAAFLRHAQMTRSAEIRTIRMPIVFAVSASDPAAARNRRQIFPRARMALAARGPTTASRDNAMAESRTISSVRIRISATTTASNTTATRPKGALRASSRSARHAASCRVGPMVVCGMRKQRPLRLLGPAAAELGVPAVSKQSSATK
jgi:hypothetical protein